MSFAHITKRSEIMHRKILFIILCSVMLVLTGCQKQTKTLVEDLTSVANIRYERYTPDVHDTLLDKVFTEDTAQQLKDEFKDGLTDKEITIDDLIAKAEIDRQRDVVAEAYKRGIGYIPKEGYTAYDDEIIANYQAGKLDSIVNCALDPRINRTNDTYTVKLSDVKTTPEKMSVELDIYGHQYTLDLSGYAWDDPMQGDPLYRYKVQDFARYSDNTLEITFVTDDNVNLTQLSTFKYICKISNTGKISNIYVEV